MQGAPAPIHARRDCARWVLGVLAIAVVWGAPTAVEGKPVGVVVPVGSQLSPPAELTAIRDALDASFDLLDDSALQERLRPSLPAASLDDLGGRLADGIDAFYEEDLASSRQGLASVVDELLQAPAVFAASPSLASPCVEAMTILIRIALREGRFDDASAIAERLVRTFPTWSTSPEQTPPAVLELCDRARLQQQASMGRLVLAGDDDCRIVLNGYTTGLADEAVIPIEPRTPYGVLLACGSSRTPPLRVEARALEQLLHVTPDTVNLVSGFLQEPSLVLPPSADARIAVASALALVLGVEEIFFVQRSGATLVVVRVSGDGYLAASGNSDSAPPDEWISVLESGVPTDNIALDSGSGWSVVATESYLAEWIVVGIGAAATIAGGALILAAAQTGDDVRACEVPGACSRKLAEERAVSYTERMFAGHLVLGVGAVVLATGASLFFARWLSSDVQEIPGVVALPSGVFLSWSRTW